MMSIVSLENEKRTVFFSFLLVFVLLGGGEVV